MTGPVAVRALSALATMALMVTVGCRQDMHNQPKFFPQRGTTFFADGRSVRPQVTDTVARGQLHEDSYFYTGMINGKEGDGLPFPVTMEVLERGQERYNVYCTPCHSRVGNGDGMIVQRGYAQAGNFHTLRLENAPLGHFFNVMTNGFGAMPDYSAQVTPVDRWAIAAYIRALQLSQNATQADVPAGAHVEPMSEIEQNEGLPAGFASDWEVPATAASSSVTPASSATPTPGSSTVAPGTPGNQNTTTPPAPGSAPHNATTSQISASVIAANPKASSASMVAAGHTVYNANCQICHQPGRTGMPPNIPSLVGVVAKIGKGQVRTTVMNGMPAGKPPMPAFGGKLSSTDVDNLIAFLSTNP